MNEEMRASLMDEIAAIAEKRGVSLPTIVRLEIANAALALVNQEAPKPLNDFVPRKQLAKEMGLNERTLINWEVDGKGPPVTRVSRKVLYSRTAFRAWLASRGGAR